MKRIFNLLILFSILNSCSFNQEEIVILKSLDQFGTQEENERLGEDILNYRFPIFLQIEHPELTEEQLKGIRLQKFIQQNTGNVSLRLIMSNKALEKKDVIQSFMTKTVNEQIEHQVNDKKIFDDALSSATACLAKLDEKDFDYVWEKTSQKMRSTASREKFISGLEPRANITQLGGKRIYHSKQFFSNIPNSNVINAYAVNFTFEDNKDINEALIFEFENGELKIVNYSFRIPKQ